MYVAQMIAEIYPDNDQRDGSFTEWIKFYPNMAMISHVQ